MHWKYFNYVGYLVSLVVALFLGYELKQLDVSLSLILSFAAVCWAGGIFLIIIIQERQKTNVNPHPK